MCYYSFNINNEPGSHYTNKQVQKDEIKLVGLTTRTNNSAEMDPSQLNAKIGPLAGKYWGEGLADAIANRKSPGITFCAYTEYETDHNGDYTYFIGEEVESFENIPEGYMKLVIPAGKYVKFTSDRGSLINVCVGLWQRIWQMGDSDFGGKRKYSVDYEVHDERSKDPENSELDIYIAI